MRDEKEEGQWLFSSARHYLISVDVQTDFIETHFDVEHRSLKFLCTGLHHEYHFGFDVQRTEN